MTFMGGFEQGPFSEKVQTDPKTLMGLGKDLGPNRTHPMTASNMGVTNDFVILIQIKHIY